MHARHVCRYYFHISTKKCELKFNRFWIVFVDVWGLNDACRYLSERGMLVGIYVVDMCLRHNWCSWFVRGWNVLALDRYMNCTYVSSHVHFHPELILSLSFENNKKNSANMHRPHVMEHYAWEFIEYPPAPSVSRIACMFDAQWNSARDKPLHAGTGLSMRGPCMRATCAAAIFEMSTKKCELKFKRFGWFSLILQAERCM